MPTAAPVIADLDAYTKGAWAVNMVCPLDNTAAYDAGINAVNVVPACGNFDATTHNAVIT